MSDEPEAPQEGAETGDKKPEYKRFRKRFDTVRLSPDAAARQGKAATLAFEKFRDSAKVKDFLNTHDDALGGRPIDLAVESDAGLAAIKALLAAS
jgi:uncharacterized protein (DUF2384 family)